MRSLINCVGLVLGLVIAGIFVVLMWPSIDLYDAKALRHLVWVALSAFVIVGGVTWPFTWLSKRL